MIDNINSLKTLLKEKGVIGNGGASYPTYAKLADNIEFILINGAECEPLLRVDQQLTDKYAKELLETLHLLVNLVGAKKGVFALKGKYKSAIKSLNENLVYDNVEIFELDNFYPAGDEQITIYEVFGKIVPEGGIPINVGIVAFNVETLLNIHSALRDKPVTHTYLTVTGEVKEPKTVKVPIGMTYRKVIELAGGATVSDFAIIEGGPMMGSATFDIEKPVVKSSKGIIVLSKEHHWIRAKTKPLKNILKEAKTACCHCSLCTEICPRNLIGHRIEPNKLIRAASYGSTCDNKIGVDSAYLCCGCGLCELACIMDLQPWKLNNFLKGTLREQGVKNPYNNAPKEAHPSRNYRKYPANKLIKKLGLTKYDVYAPLDESDVDCEEVVILTRQNIGASASPIVKVNDNVLKGQVIAEGNESTLSINLHSSISGVVTFVNDDKIIVRGV